MYQGNTGNLYHNCLYGRTDEQEDTMLKSYNRFCSVGAHYDSEKDRVIPFTKGTRAKAKANKKY